MLFPSHRNKEVDPPANGWEVGTVNPTPTATVIRGTLCGDLHASAINSLTPASGSVLLHLEK